MSLQQHFNSEDNVFYDVPLDDDNIEENKYDEDLLNRLYQSYIEDYIKIKKHEGKLYILELQHKKKCINISKLLISIMEYFEEEDNIKHADNLAKYIINVDEKDFSNFVNNII